MTTGIFCGARRGEFGLGGHPTAVLGDDDVDAVPGDEQALFIDREGRAPGDQLVFGQRQGVGRRLDDADQEPHALDLRERRGASRSDAEKSALAKAGQDLGRAGHVVDLPPIVFLDPPPGRSGQDQPGDAALGARGFGVGRHDLGEGVGGVDQPIDRFVFEKEGQPVGAAEAAPAHPSGKVAPGRQTPGQGGDDLYPAGVGLAGEARHLGGFRGAAEDEQALNHRHGRSGCRRGRRSQPRPPFRRKGLPAPLRGRGRR